MAETQLPDEFTELASSERLSDLLNEVTANPELKRVTDIKLVFDYIAEVLKGAKVVDYLIGYKPAPFVRETDDELAVTVLTTDHVFEFVFGPHRKRYDMTPLEYLSWIKVDEREYVGSGGGLEPSVRFEAVFGGTGITLQVEATGDKATRLKGLAGQFRRLLGRYRTFPVVGAVHIRG